MTDAAEVGPVGAPGATNADRPARGTSADDGQPPSLDIDDRNDVMAAVRDVFADGEPRDRETALRELAALLGCQRLGPRIRESLDNDLRAAVRRGVLENAPQGLRIAGRKLSDYTRDHLIAMLLADAGQGWWERDDLIRATARYLGFRRTGSEIKTALKSAINGAIRRDLLEPDGTRVRKAR